VSKFYKAEGIILRRRNYKESDRIITIFSKEYGLITVLAKSVRTTKSRKRGFLEIFSQVKLKCVTARGFDILTEVDILEDFENIRTDIKKGMVAYYYCEAILKLTKENQELRGVYELLLRHLKKLNLETPTKKTRQQFVRELLGELGYYPLDKEIADPDAFLQTITERQINTTRVGKRVLEK